MKIAIIDDNQKDIEYLLGLAEDYCEKHHIAKEISLFSSGDIFLDSFQSGSYQCVFLDIYMNGTDGMSIARKIRQKDPKCSLIFCSSSLSHAAESYEVRASWYLAKPFSKELLERAMDAAVGALIKEQSIFTIHSNGAPFSVKYDNIYYLDCENRQAQLHTKQKTIAVDETIGTLQEQLSEDARFLICNRNIMVNLDHIERVEGDHFIMKNGIHVPIRQRDRASLKKKFLSWSLHSLFGDEQI